MTLQTILSNPATPLVLAGVLNLWISAGYFGQKNLPMALVFFCYGVSCGAFVWGMGR